MNYPGSGVQKVAIPFNERKGKIKFPNNKLVAVHVYVAIEYGVEHKLILGSDFPSATLDQVIAGQWKVNSVVDGTKFPRVSDEIIHQIIYENWKQVIEL